MITIKFTPKTKSVFAQIDGLKHGFESGLYSALQDIGSEFVREEVRLQKRRDKTGRLYSFMGGLLRASAPGEVPQRRTGRLSKSTDSKTHSHLYMTFGQEEDYAKFLAEGTRHMAPRSNLTVAVYNKTGLAGELLKQGVNREAKLD